MQTLRFHPRGLIALAVFIVLGLSIGGVQTVAILRVFIVLAVAWVFAEAAGKLFGFRRARKDRYRDPLRDD